MALSSELFTKEGPGKQRLADCAASHQSNFFVGKPKLPGTDDAVERIQTALRTLGFDVTDPAGVYGNSTAKAVFEFKSAHKPKPILGPGQRVPDRVVGIQTIDALDKALPGKRSDPKPPGPTPPKPTPPKPTPPPPAPKPTPPPPAPKPTDQAWKFTLKLQTGKIGISSFRLALTDPVSNETENFLTSLKPNKFVNTLGTPVNCIQVGTLMFPQGTTLDDIFGCDVFVALKHLGDRAVLNGALAVVDADKGIDARATVNGAAEGQFTAGGHLFVASELQRSGG